MSLALKPQFPMVPQKKPEECFFALTEARSQSHTTCIYSKLPAISIKVKRIALSPPPTRTQLVVLPSEECPHCLTHISLYAPPSRLHVHIPGLEKSQDGTGASLTQCSNCWATSQGARRQAFHPCWVLNDLKGPGGQLVVRGRYAIFF